MSIATLNPDVVLAEALKDNVIVNNTPKGKRYTIKAFPANKQPNKALPKEYLSVYQNGIIESKTKPIGLYYGNLALAIFVETQSDGTAKTHIIRQIMEQCETIVNCKSYGGFYYELDPVNVITPTTTNISTGYSTTILNVSWHTTHG